MQGGFSFCGVDIESLGLEYAPETKNTYVFSGSRYSVNEESFDSHNGGYFYGTTVNPKDFTLRCFYQDSNINNGILCAVENFFYRGRTGKLIFKNRDWIWYSATVISIDASNMTNYANGFVTITMRAYYPFGRFDSLYLSESDSAYQNEYNNSALLTQAETPNTYILDNGNVLTAEHSVLLYNGGTEKASVAIEIAGDVGQGVTLLNEENGQECKFVAISTTTCPLTSYVVCDALNGKTFIVDRTAGTSSLNFLFHDRGFIELEPAYPIKRGISVNYFFNSRQITSNALFDASDKGKYILLGGTWTLVTDVLDASTATIETLMEEDGTIQNTSIVKMNKITITPSTTMLLTRLNFIYKPTFQ